MQLQIYCYPQVHVFPVEFPALSVTPSRPLGKAWGECVGGGILGGPPGQ